MLRLSTNIAPYLFGSTFVIVAILARGQMPFQASHVARDARTTSNGWEIAYQRGGPTDTPLVIYVHGTPGSSGAFTRYVSEPVGDTQSISIDRPGFGETVPFEPVPSMAEQAEALEPFLENHGGALPILVGHSMGAPVIVQAAIDFPERVGGLVIISGALDPDLERIFWYQYLGESGIIPQLLPKTIVHSNRELLPLEGELRRLAERLDEVQCPVVIVHAENDSLVPFSNVAFMRDAFPEGVISGEFLLDHGDHFLPWNSEPVVREAIRSLLDR